ncbi:DUF6174 domain-containing protein [Pseudoalteromonas denitrificans]|uniref:Uncharacterized protein n=1 Tax=Pseudoalteromonas denitrificans DSM 6059 TaxID=1123010 RepID=A0A1I1I8M2_9GAMM|nr:DUF6174 domain-containing protein [Pseudoalteromonas denitrificans]SFC32514.1 hypothetical protein SAMN02745724_01430 [Pseudoalteromonas denitrificans DSM 6059]
MLPMQYISAITLVSILGCNSSSETDQQREFDLNQAKWDALNITQYTLDQRRSCFCLPEATQTTTLLIKDNEIELSYAKETEVITNKNLRNSFLKVDELFKKASELINNSDELQVEYHAQYGFPTYISVDIDKQTADDEYSITTSNFTDNTNIACIEVLTPSFNLIAQDANTTDSLNCQLAGSYQFEDKEPVTFDNSTSDNCDNNHSLDIASDSGIASITINVDGYHSKTINNIHVIADHCAIKTQDITVELEKL